MPKTNAKFEKLSSIHDNVGTGQPSISRTDVGTASVEVLMLEQ